MKRGARLIRKLIIGAIGIPLLVTGVILIPIPGPGLLICFIALFILSLGFDFAGDHYDKAKAGIKKIYDEAKTRADRIYKD